ncbi:MAG TPA: PKD domain-containing protein, partial [Tenuifilaceae bacterium]|nr:PKD domain-containing protein [Tenuifilaceae bacterium]
FGDIPTVTGKVQKHVFQTTGDHTVRLIITNNNLQNDTVYGIAHVEPIPTVSFTADDVCEGLTATIVNPANTNGLIDWIWDFGDGSTSNYFNPGTHTYAEKKNYTIKFKVTGENNCSNTATKTIAIKERPAKPTISESTNNFCPGTEVKLEVTSTTNGLNFQWKRNGDIIDGATNSIYTGKLTAADYSVVVEPGSCSSESNKLTIVTKPAPPKPTILGHGPTVWILACDNMTATNYRWYYNNNLIPGANKYQYVANKNYGDYYVTVNDGGECWTPSDVFKVDLPNGIADLANENVRVFPNPSEGVFNVSLGVDIPGEVNVRIMDVLGKVVLTQIYNTTDFPIDISQVTNGIYYISIMYKNEVIIKKVVKQ